MRIFDRPLAFTDVETFGLDENIHDIVEIGLVIADQYTLEEIASFHTKVMPKRPHLASPRAIEINGYNPEDWRDAVSLHDAMSTFGSMTKEAMMAAWNVALDSRYILRGFRVTGVPDEMDYHRVDLCTVAWDHLRHTDIQKFSLESVCSFLGIEPEPMPHRGINGARKALEVLRALRSAP